MRRYPVGGRHRALHAQAFATGENFIAQRVRVDDADQLHAVRLARTLARGLHAQDAQVVEPQDGAFDEGHVLDVLQRDGLLHPEQDALAELQRAIVQRAAQPVEVVPCPPLSRPQYPHQDQRCAEDGQQQVPRHHRHQIRPDQRIERGVQRGRLGKGVGCRHGRLQSGCAILACLGSSAVSRARRRCVGMRVAQTRTSSPFAPRSMGDAAHAAVIFIGGLARSARARHSASTHAC